MSASSTRPPRLPGSGRNQRLTRRSELSRNGSSGGSLARTAAALEIVLEPILPCYGECAGATRHHFDKATPGVVKTIALRATNHQPCKNPIRDQPVAHLHYRCEVCSAPRPWGFIDYKLYCSSIKELFESPEHEDFIGGFVAVSRWH